eukprot:gene7652-biopygen17440
MEVYEDFEMPGRATVSRNPYQAAMDDVMCSVFCERSVVYSASKTLFNLHYLSVTDELVPHDAMSSGRFYGGLNRILFPVIVKADPIMCEAAEPLHQFKISMMYDTGSTLSYMTLEVLHALGYKNAVYPPDPKLPHSEHMYEVCISGISTQTLSYQYVYSDFLMETSVVLVPGRRYRIRIHPNLMSGFSPEVLHHPLLWDRVMRYEGIDDAFPGKSCGKSCGNTSRIFTDGLDTLSFVGVDPHCVDYQAVMAVICACQNESTDHGTTLHVFERKPGDGTRQLEVVAEVSDEEADSADPGHDNE